MAFGCMGAHGSPSPDRSLWEVSSAQGTLPKISRRRSAKMRGTEFVSGNASPCLAARWAGASAHCSVCSALPAPPWGAAGTEMLVPVPWSAWDTRVLQPCQHHAETSALLTSLLPEQVHFINEGISKGLILPLAQFKAPPSGEVPHPWPRMLPLKLRLCMLYSTLILAVERLRT